MKGDQDGILILSSSVAVNSYLGVEDNKIRIIPTTELPPPPPVEINSNPPEAGKSQIPSAFVLEQNYPNPFNPSTVIRYQLPVASYVSLKVYDILGQEVAKLVDGIQDAGHKSVELIASTIPSGVYVYRIQAGSFTEVKKLILMK